MEYITRFTIVRDSFRNGAVRFFEWAGLAHSTSTKKELILSLVGIELVNNKNWVVSLPPTALLLIADVKVEDFVA